MKKILILSQTLILLLFLSSCGGNEAPADHEKAAEGKAMMVNQKPKVAQFETLIVQPANKERNIVVTGRLQPIEKLQVVSEVQGRTLSTGKLLNEGIRYRKGETLIRIDNDQYVLNLKAQKSRFRAGLVRIMSQIQLDYPDAYPTWDKYLMNFKEAEILPALPEVSNAQLRYFLSANNIYTEFYNIKSAEELLPKYSIKAPFSGVITQGSVAPNSVVSPGVPLANLSRTDVYELKASVSSSDIEKFAVGKTIELQHRNTGESYQGKIHRLGGTIDPSTQAVPVFIRVRGKGLREGMFLEANLISDSFENVVEVPLHAMNRSNQVLVIQDSVVNLQAVEPVNFNSDRVWVKGLKSGDEVVVEKVIEPIVGVKAVGK